MCNGHGQVRSSQGFFTVQQTCPQCSGSGEQITNPCTSCSGQGKKQASKRLSVTIPKGVDDGTRIRLAGKGEAGSRGAGSGEEITNPCSDCSGQGNKQTSKKISVTIPKGVDDGTRIRLAGKGEAGVRGGTTGDLYLFINVESHDVFKRSDVNLFYEFPISIADAALGTTIEIPTIDGGKAKIKIPDGTQNGKQFRLKGKGMPFMRRGDFGDLYVQVKTEIPVSLNKEQKELLEKFRKIDNERSNPSIKKFFQKAKSFWKN